MSRNFNKFFEHLHKPISGDEVKELFQNELKELCAKWDVSLDLLHEKGREITFVVLLPRKL